MHELLKKNKHGFLYHFTDSKNISEIKRQGGLLSLRELLARKVANVTFGGNQWSHEADTYVGLDDYVHLCFLSNHPMEYVARQDKRITATFWVQISPDIVLTPGVRYSADVSNKSGVRILTSDEVLAELDLDAIFKHLDFGLPGNQERKNKAQKYEILVPKRVPLSLIGNI